MPKFVISYRDEARPDSAPFSFGAFSQIAAKRRYGVAAVRPGSPDQDPESLLFAAFVELEGPQAAKDPEAFDEWLLGVESLDEHTNGTDPTTATTETPSASSPDSPPTSD